ncbi:hypothetical protein BD779DRAFT_1508950 [Infundibulicybe gibba]|nr:hypothetical protein BD779DRAFT_1508950 [Infundibulicybe gibba]
MGDAPMLQSMQCIINGFESEKPVPLHMLDRCPHLGLFRWDSFGSPLLLPLRNTQLTSLLIRTFLSVSECTTLLQLSPCLFKADFFLVESADPSPRAVPHVTHSTLRILTTAGRHSDTFLGTLTLPALEDLDLTGVAALTDWDIILFAFLERSRPALRYLSLFMAFAQSHESGLLQILALTPHLRTLRLSDCGLDSSPSTATLIRALHPSPPPGTSLCPCLQDLYLSGVSGCPDGLWGAMLRARWGAQARANGVACLERGHIELESGVHDRDEADVEELRADGMWVVFRLEDW